MFAIREDRAYVVNEDFTKAARKLMESKKLESKLEYAKVYVSLLNKQAGVSLCHWTSSRRWKGHS